MWSEKIFRMPVNPTEYEWRILKLDPTIYAKVLPMGSSL